MNTRNDTDLRPSKALALAAAALALILLPSISTAASGVHGRVFALTEKGAMKGAIANARIEFLHQGGGTAIRVNSDADGYYWATLSPGTYLYKVSATGFRDENLGRGIEMVVKDGAAVYNLSLTPEPAKQPETDSERPQESTEPLPSEESNVPDIAEVTPPADSLEPNEDPKRPEPPDTNRPQPEVQTAMVHVQVVRVRNAQETPMSDAEIVVFHNGEPIAAKPLNRMGQVSFRLPRDPYEVRVHAAPGMKRQGLDLRQGDARLRFTYEMQSEQPMPPPDDHPQPTPPTEPHPSEQLANAHIEVLARRGREEMPLAGAEVVVLFAGRPVREKAVDRNGRAFFQLRREQYEVQAHTPGLGMQRQRLDLRGGNAHARILFQQKNQPGPEESVPPNTPPDKGLPLMMALLQVHVVEQTRMGAVPVPGAHVTIRFAGRPMEQQQANRGGQATFQLRPQRYEIQVTGDGFHVGRQGVDLRRGHGNARVVLRRIQHRHPIEQDRGPIERDRPGRKEFPPIEGFRMPERTLETRPIGPEFNRKDNREPPIFRPQHKEPEPMAAEPNRLMPVERLERVE